jgi:hypothetical protein
VAQAARDELMDSFDFNAWAKLARTAPDKFEQQRRDFVDNYISNSNGNVRLLRGLQCRIDLERIRAGTPLKSCLRLTTLMWDAFIDLNNKLNTVAEGGYDPAITPSHPGKSAKIIPFCLSKGRLN